VLVRHAFRRSDVTCFAGLEAVVAAQSSVRLIPAFGK
jgi:hypothetical protein